MPTALRQLAVVAGPHAGLLAALGRHPVTIGRAPGCGLVLPDADTSRRHAVAEVVHGVVHVHDLGSANGTSIDGEPVGVVPQPVWPGSVLQIGESVLVEDTARREGSDPVALLRGLAPAADGLQVRLGNGAAGPVTYDLGLGPLGITGPYATGSVRWLIAQVATRLPGVRVVVVSARAALRWHWCALLPDARVLEGEGSEVGAAFVGAPAPVLVVADLRGARYGPSVDALAACPAAIVIGRPGDPWLRQCPSSVHVTGETGTRLRLDGGTEFVLDAVSESWAVSLASALHLRDAVPDRRTARA